MVANHLKGLVKRAFQPKARKAILGQHPYGGPDDGSMTFVVVVREGFNINVPNANSTSRLGFCRGFAEIGVRYHLVSVFEIEGILPQLRKPFVFLSEYDYLDMTRGARKILRDYPHFVWVRPNFEVLQEVASKFGTTYARTSPRVYRRVLESQPNFVWGNVPPSCLEFYSEWEKLGLRLEAIPLACDTGRYYPEAENRGYAEVKMAFVGGYWSRKAIQFDKYLKPYEDIMTVFGYSSWPYKGYRGLLPEGDEKVLYRNALVSPAISEPHAEVMGDIVERAFKIMGSGGLAITDVVRFYSELFAPDELLVPSNLEEYHNMVHLALTDEDFNRRYRKKGYQAVLDRHTYAHRARTILGFLGVDQAPGH